MDKIRWGIIGPGSIAHNFADALKQSYSGELISIASDSDVKSQSTNLEIAYNFSNKMRDFLPLKNMTTDDVRNFKDVEFNNALLKKFTNYLNFIHSILIFSYKSCLFILLLNSKYSERIIKWEEELIGKNSVIPCINDRIIISIIIRLF